MAACQPRACARATVHSALGRRAGISEEQLRGLAQYRHSDVFTPLEKHVLDYAVAITRTPVDVVDELFEELRKHFNEAERVELTAAIAQENFRARFNRPFKVEAVGFSHGGYCPLPEHLEPLPQSSA